MNRFLPPITQRALIASVVLGIGIATNAWHKNTLSGLVIVVTAIALGVWLGTELGKRG